MKIILQVTIEAVKEFQKLETTDNRPAMLVQSNQSYSSAKE